MPKSKVFIVTDLGLGDAGKGTIVDYLARHHPVKSVIRFNGGPQAAHCVVTADGRHHVFAQFGSGSFSGGVETFLSGQMLVELENLMVENEYLIGAGIKDGFERLTVDPSACLVTPAHKMLGQLKEIKRGSKRLGSCGMGVGEAAKDRADKSAITVADCLDKAGLKIKLARQFETKFRQVQPLMKGNRSAKAGKLYHYFQERLNPVELAEIYHGIVSRLRLAPSAKYLSPGQLNGANLIFEGAQGVLLDHEYGFYPYVTKTRSTGQNALALLQSAVDSIELEKYFEISRVGVIRAYGHRHGAGPFVSESPRLRKYFQDKFNLTNSWQGKFRVGWLDMITLNYGLFINGGVDYLALTNLDQLSGLARIKVCVAYSYQGDLSQLDKFFIWKKTGENQAIIYAIKKADPLLIGTGQLAELLLRCKLGKWLEFPGWQQDISRVKKLADLPRQARGFLTYLQNPTALYKPIKIISVNATEEGKIWID